MPCSSTSEVDGLVPSASCQMVFDDSPLLSVKTFISDVAVLAIYFWTLSVLHTNRLPVRGDDIGESLGEPLGDSLGEPIGDNLGEPPGDREASVCIFWPLKLRSSMLFCCWMIT